MSLMNSDLLNFMGGMVTKSGFYAIWPLATGE
jgi:hypothetical protein